MPDIDDDKPGAEEEKGPDELGFDAHRPLDPWERYRALNDAYDLQQELIDLGDHKARFALVIMTGLSAVAFLMVARTDVLTTLPEGLRPWIAGYVVLYGMTALYFFFQAIESLKPAHLHGRSRQGPARGALLRGHPAQERRGVPEDLLSSVRVEQLSEEIAEQVLFPHPLSRPSILNCNQESVSPL